MGYEGILETRQGVRTGPNEVMPTVIDEWLELMLHIMNGILQTGIIPKRWKEHSVFKVNFGP